MSSMHLPVLHMLQIIAPDAPLTSPISDSLPVPWDRDTALITLYDPFSLPLSASPPSSARIMPGALFVSVPDTRKVFAPGANPGTPQYDMLASSSAAFTPELSPQTQSQPLPQHTHHTSSFSTSSCSSSMAGTPSAGSVVVPAKWGSSLTATKEARGERITVKDFVPPDVTGLT